MGTISGVPWSELSNWRTFVLSLMEFGTEQSHADRAIPERQQYGAIFGAGLHRFKRRTVTT